jgi:hypothetical protein
MEIAGFRVFFFINVGLFLYNIPIGISNVTALSVNMLPGKSSRNEDVNLLFERSSE